MVPNPIPPTETTKVTHKGALKQHHKRQNQKNQNSRTTKPWTKRKKTPEETSEIENVNKARRTIYDDI